MIRRWLQPLRDLFQRRRFERDLDDELQFHLDSRTEQLVATGLSHGEAIRQARIELGMTELHRDGVRAARGLRVFDLAWGDLRYAARSLRRTPGFSLTAISVLSLPLAASLILYLLFDTYALQMPPVQRPQRWFYLEGIDELNRGVALLSPAQVEAIDTDLPPGVEGFYTTRYLHRPLQIEGRGGEAWRGGEAVSDHYFRLLGPRLQHGRGFLGGADPRDRYALVLSDHGWERLFQRDPQVIGRGLDIAGQRYTVVGVTAAGFTGTYPMSSLYWIRERDYRAHLPADEVDQRQLDLNGFLADDGSLDALNEALGARAQQLPVAADEDLVLHGLRAVPRRGVLREGDREEAMLAGLPVAAAVLLMLLIAAANLANLVLARFAARRHDMALRAALGAGRRRLLLQLLTECGLLALAAAALALALAALCIHPVHAATFSLLAEMGYDLIDIQLGAGSAVTATVMALIATLLFGGLPAWLVTAPWSARRRGQPDAAALKRADGSRLRGGLMVAQVAGSVLLLVIAGLIGANARRAELTPLGFDPAPLVAFDAGRDAQALARALREQAEVAALGGVSSLPLMSEGERMDGERDGRSDPLRVRFIDAGWLEVMNIALQRGRAFNAADAASAPVAVISRRTAELLWPRQDPLGRTLRLVRPDEAPAAWSRSVEVIGVVDDVASGWLVSGADHSMVYLPAAIGDGELGQILLRLHEASPRTLSRLHAICVDIDPGADCAPFRLSSALRVQRLPFLGASRLASAIGWTSLLISCIGLYGLVSYVVVQQRKELGVRLALGAQRSQLIRHVMRGAVRQIALGIALGLPLAIGLSRVIAALTDRLQTVDIGAFVIAPLLLAAIAVLAAWLPARRSARIAPSEALRADS